MKVGKIPDEMDLIDAKKKVSSFLRSIQNQINVYYADSQRRVFVILTRFLECA